MCGLAIPVSKPGKGFEAEAIQRALVQRHRHGPDAKGALQDHDDEGGMGVPQCWRDVSAAWPDAPSDLPDAVELRTPLVDAWLLHDLQPMLGAFSQFPNKRLLAESPARPLPEDLITRRKTGFGIPVQKWLAQIGHASAGAGPSNAWACEVASLYEKGGL